MNRRKISSAVRYLMLLCMHNMQSQIKLFVCLTDDYVVGLIPISAYRHFAEGYYKVRSYYATQVNKGVILWLYYGQRGLFLENTL